MPEWELSSTQQPGNPDRPEEIKEAFQPPHEADVAREEAVSGPLSATHDHPGEPNSGMSGGTLANPNSGRTGEQLEDLVTREPGGSGQGGSGQGE